MRILICALCTLLGLAAVAGGQMPGPAKELGKFDVMLGNWTGSGTVRMAGDTPELPWTATTTVSKVLDGHFIQEDVKIDVGPEAPAPMLFRKIYGWDAHRKTYVAYEMGNLGGLKMQKVNWIDDKTLVSANATKEAGTPVFDRLVARFTKDSYNFHIDRATGSGPFFVHVKGSFKRGKAITSVSKDTAKLAMGPPATQMGVLRGQIGEWNMKGKVSGMPGMPLLPFTGRQKIDSILGGHVHLAYITGDKTEVMPINYRGQLYTAWDDEEQCYRSLSLDNFGGGVLENAFMRGKNKMIYTSTSVQYGMAQAMRTILEFDTENGSIKISTDRSADDHVTGKSFEAEMKRVIMK